MAGIAETIKEIVATRRAQLLPQLTTEQMAAASRFGGPKKIYAPREVLFSIGDRGRNMYLILDGTIEINRRDSSGNDEFLVAHGQGHFTGDIGDLSNHASFAIGRAGSDGCAVIPFDSAQLHALVVGNAEIGEIVMRAFLARRLGVIDAGGIGLSILGTPSASAEVDQLQFFLTRSGHPHILLDPSHDPEAAATVTKLGLRDDQLPVVMCYDGTLLYRPTITDLARHLGMMPELDAKALYDVAIIGAGPGGLATAVYAASEGLSVIVVEASVIGGQAGASARIENYLGFPAGVPGGMLMGLAYAQASKFGAIVVAPVAVEGLDCRNEPGEPFKLALSDGQALRARSVIIASGARYRRPDIEGFRQLEGRGVSFWASPIEAKQCAGKEVVVVGGGNSAGQAVVYLAGTVSRVHVLVRRGLAATMSRYLIDRIASCANVEIHEGAQLTGLDGDAAQGLRKVAWRVGSSGPTVEKSVQSLFCFIGADPNTDWLADCAVTLDAKGFVLTGADAALEGGGRQTLETSVRGIFAIGDVRAGSTKRVAAAVGEGAAVVAQLHSALTR